MYLFGFKKRFSSSSIVDTILKVDLTVDSARRRGNPHGY
jgi:hypothetical protein